MLLPLARDEVTSAALWYDERREGLGADFWETVKTASKEISGAPRRFGALENVRTSREIRRYVLGRFPYVIIYEVAEDEVIIAAIAHGCRRPGYRLDRLPSNVRRG